MANRKFWAFVALITLLTMGREGWAQDAPTHPANLGFEQGKVGQEAPGWFVPPVVAEQGWAATLSGDNPKTGKSCVVLRRKNEQESAGFGNLMQTFDASAYRGKRIRLRGFVRLAPADPGDRAQMWLRVDKPDGQTGLFDNMGDRPITAAKRGWQLCSIVGDVDKDATQISIGLLLLGTGEAYFDNVSLTVLGTAGSDNAAPRPLTERGLQNLTAFTRLLGYVRYFYPGDVATKTDWNAFAVASVPEIEATKDASELAQKLTSLFKPIAPTVAVWPTDSVKPSLPAVPKPIQKAGSVRVVSWKHTGYGFGDIKSAYSSERVRTPGPGTTGKVLTGQPDPQKPFEAEIGGGMTCRVPLALFADDGGILPRQNVTDEAEAPTALSGNDRNVRLADVALAWNVFQNFYPYFDVVKTDWPAVLTTSLSSAATDKDDVAFAGTLRRMVAALQDGHGGVYGVGQYGFTFPFVWRWIENKLVVTQTLPGDTIGLKPGDVITQINGKPVEDIIAAQEEMISAATPQWKRWRAVSEIAQGPENSEATLQFQRGTGEPKTVTLKRTLSTERRLKEHLLEEKRPADFAEIRPGIFYVDIGKVTKAELDKNLPNLAGAKGLICDLRGYPTGDALELLSHIATKPFISANWNVPIFTRPDRQGVTYQTSHWPETLPAAPHVGGKIVFLIDGRAISYAESYMGIVEAYKMAEIVGGPTAGTNGNVNPFTLPGGYRVVWTGMKVTKHDGSRHHGVGIAPTVPAAPTVQGVSEGRDEVLEKGIAVINAVMP